MKKLVVIKAPLLSTSGYGVHSRQVFRWLLEASERYGFDLQTIILPWGITSWSLNQEAHGGLIGEAMRRSSNISRKPDVSFQIQLPNEWDPNLALMNVGITAAVETDRCSTEWVSCCNKMDMVVVPSSHALSVLKNSGNVRTPTFVIGESFPDECLKEASLELDIDTDFNFLVFGQLTDHNPQNDRKNLLNTIKWLFDEFKDDPDVGIVLKTNSGKGTKIDRGITRSVLKRVVDSTRQGLNPKLHFLHGNLTNDEIAGLYRNEKIKALVSATRGEGFGLPLLEAAACGLPIAATDWSGHKDFLDLGDFSRIDYDVKEIPESKVDGMIFILGSRWAEPDEQSFRTEVRKIKNEYDDKKKNAIALQKEITNSFSQENIAKKYDSMFRGYLC